MRGWLVPGFWPMMKIASRLVEVVERHRALADADGFRQRRRRSTRGTCSSSRAGCWCRTAARRAGTGTRPRCWCVPTCRRPPRRASRSAVQLRGDQRERVVPRDRLVVVGAARRTIGWVSRPCLLEPMVATAPAARRPRARRRTPASTRCAVASSATALAPFSQNSPPSAWLVGIGPGAARAIEAVLLVDGRAPRAPPETAPDP